MEELFCFRQQHTPQQLRQGNANYSEDFCSRLWGAAPEPLAPTRGSPGQLVSPLQQLHVPFKGRLAAPSPWGTIPDPCHEHRRELFIKTEVG